MKTELESKIKAGFPFMEAGSGAYEQYGIEVHDGWYSLLHDMCEEIQAAGGDIEVRQIKAKFGMLRVYYRTSNAKVDEIVRRYEERSQTVCELCGQPGSYRREQVIVLCNSCYEEVIS